MLCFVPKEGFSWLPIFPAFSILATFGPGFPHLVLPNKRCQQNVVCPLLWEFALQKTLIFIAPCLINCNKKNSS